MPTEGGELETPDWICVAVTIFIPPTFQHFN